jgi:4-diphosphocytidyl-2-C-methyl-D-erythritol kinase
MSAALQARCPAKINLYLRVLGRRDDGYHELDTLFQTVDLWDQLDAHPAERLTLTCDDRTVPTDGTNLVLRAARLAAERSGRRGLGARFSLRKAIPAGGGLGGASSDAAGALLLCARLWQLPIDRRELQALGAELGADVPFFLSGGTARGTGRGDRIEPLDPLGTIPLLLGFPPFGVSTAEVFGRWTPPLTPHGFGVSVSRPATHKSLQERELGCPVNDLEAVVFAGWPELLAFRDALREAGADPALLSGSGSTVYGIFTDRSRLEQACARLGDRFPRWRLIATRTVEARAHLVGSAERRG